MLEGSFDGRAGSLLERRLHTPEFDDVDIRLHIVSLGVPEVAKASLVESVNRFGHCG